MCLARSVHDGDSRFCAVSVRDWAFLAPLDRTVICCRVPWRRSSRKLLRFPWGLGLPVLSQDCELLSSSLPSPGSSHPDCHGSLTGFDFAGLVVWWILAPRSKNQHSQSGPFFRFLTFWRLCEESWSPSLFPHSLQYSLASCLAALPLPHYRGSRDHGRSSAGFICWVSALLSAISWWYHSSCLAQGCVPLLRPNALLPALGGNVPSGSLLLYIAPGLRVEDALPGRVSVLDRNEGSSYTFLVFGTKPLRWGHPYGSRLAQASIGTKTILAPSLVCWCPAFAMRSPLFGCVAYFYALVRNEGLFHPPILDFFAMGSPYGSSVVFPLDRN